MAFVLRNFGFQKLLRIKTLQTRDLEASAPKAVKSRIENNGTACHGETEHRNLNIITDTLML